MYRTDSGTGDNPHETSGFVPPAGLGALPWWSMPPVASKCVKCVPGVASAALAGTRSESGYAPERIHQGGVESPIELVALLVHRRIGSRRSGRLRLDHR